ncbi:MAG: DUF2628 domain-containing protein [Alphaproteobacteria bacterium]|nr:DUF2628 domain-containing protein [Alphaproteobacteria bacterium]
MSQKGIIQYYEKAFDRLEKTGKHTWNCAAFFGGITWMLYRRMYLYGLVLTLIYFGMDWCLIENAAHWKGTDAGMGMVIVLAMDLIAPRMCLMFLMLCLRDVHRESARHLANGWMNIDPWELWTITAVIGFIITRIYLGYFGNSLYYRIVKKRIKEGYYLIDEHPTSIPSCFGSIFYLFGLDSHPKLESKHVVNKESIRDYLNPDR